MPYSRTTPAPTRECLYMNILEYINPLRKPTALRVATEHLEDAQRDRLAAAAQREYFAYMERMLAERVARLRTEIAHLTKEAENERDSGNR